jgi:uncharacterized protein
MKQLLCILLCLAAVLAFLPGASGAAPKIVDQADILTTEQEQRLEKMAQALADTYQIDVVILTVWSLDGKTAEAYADDFFDQNGYGFGRRYSGVIFLLSMEYRDWAISTSGDAIYALTDYGIEKLFESIRHDLSDDDYYHAFRDYIRNLEPYFEALKNDNPIDGFHDADIDDYTIYDPNNSNGTVYYTPLSQTAVMLLISVAIGLATATVSLLVMRAHMNTFRQQKDANTYITDGSFRLTQKQDIFLYERLSKRQKETDSSNSHRRRRSRSSSGRSSFGSSSRSRGGGSSTHRSSSGRIHGGRSGKF